MIQSVPLIFVIALNALQLSRSPERVQNDEVLLASFTLAICLLATILEIYLCMKYELSSILVAAQIFVVFGFPMISATLSITKTSSVFVSVTSLVVACIAIIVRMMDGRVWKVT